VDDKSETTWSKITSPWKSELVWLPGKRGEPILQTLPDDCNFQIGPVTVTGPSAATIFLCVQSNTIKDNLQLTHLEPKLNNPAMMHHCSKCIWVGPKKRSKIVSHADFCRASQSLHRWPDRNKMPLRQLPPSIYPSETTLRHGFECILIWFTNLR